MQDMWLICVTICFSFCWISFAYQFQAHVYQADHNRCSAFLANIDEKKAATVSFRGQTYTIPPWSVSILPDCRNTVFNTAKVGLSKEYVLQNNFCIILICASWHPSGEKNSSSLMSLTLYDIYTIIFLWMLETYFVAKVGAQTSIKLVEHNLPLFSNLFSIKYLMHRNDTSHMSNSWMIIKEPIGVWSKNSFTVQGILEHLNVTKDESDYLWYSTR